MWGYGGCLRLIIMVIEFNGGYILVFFGIGGGKI